MSDEKMRELMSRMTEMSPKPPDFPDGVLTVKPVRSQRSGAWVFAVAGLAVFALALPFVLWQGDGGEVGGPETTVAVPDTTIPLWTGSTMSEPPDPNMIGMRSIYYLVQDPENSFVGNPTLVPFVLHGWATHLDSVTEELKGTDFWRLITHPDETMANIPDGFRTAIPPGVEVLDVHFDEPSRTVTFDMNEKFLEGAGGLLADFTMLNQLIYSATSIDMVDGLAQMVRFTVGGNPVEAFGLEGLSLVDPVDRDSFRAHLSPILLIEPVTIGDRDGMAGSLRLAGEANVFEATVSYRIGELAEGSTMASCGTGCWGDFEIIARIVGGTEDLSGLFVEIYSESGMDGSATNVIRIPLNAVIDANVYAEFTQY